MRNLIESWIKVQLGQYIARAASQSPYHITYLSKTWLSWYLGNIQESLCLFIGHTYLEVHFYTPVFRREVLWYGDVRPSVRPGLRPSVRHSFPHFSPTCFEILSWNVVYHFIMMHVRASSNAINFRQFLMELCPFLTSNCYKYAVFRTFLLHALTFWAEILHMTLFYCTTEQVRVSPISVNF